MEVKMAINALSDTQLSDMIYVFVVVFIVGMLLLIVLSLFFREEGCKRRTPLRPKRRGLSDTPNETNLIIS